MTDKEKEELMEFGINHCNEEERIRLIKICDRLLLINDLILNTLNIEYIIQLKAEREFLTNQKYKLLISIKERIQHEKEIVVGC